jgi:hypothetical protein
MALVAVPLLLAGALNYSVAWLSAQCAVDPKYRSFQVPEPTSFRMERLSSARTEGPFWSRAGKESHRSPILEDVG